VGLEPVVANVWELMRWPLMLLCAILGVDLVYHFAPNRRRPWRWITPGSVTAAALWLIASCGFKWYLATLGSYAATYGMIAGAVVTMLWLYLSGLAILIGAEVNGVVEARAAARPGHRTG
jgi:membrane protein